MPINNSISMNLKREDIVSGRIEELMKEAERQGITTRVPPEQRQVSKKAVLQSFGADEVWIFGYGSLMWNPCIHYAERQAGLIHGYHRSFCLQSPTGRGTPECPGLMLALKPGGSCRGIAYRIDHDLADAELDVVWNREMVSGAYRPRILPVRTAVGRRRAVVFVINRHHPRYLPVLSLEESAATIAKASGWLGSCADYLFNTVAHLDELGIGDSHMHELMRRVVAHQAR